MSDNVFLCIFLFIFCFQIAGICFFAYMIVKAIAKYLGWEDK